MGLLPFYAIVLYDDDLGAELRRGNVEFGEWTMPKVYLAGFCRVDSDSHEGAAEQTFSLLGNSPGGRKPAGFSDRSMSVGDVVIVQGPMGGPRVFWCRAVGWQEVALTAPLQRALLRSGRESVADG